MSYSNGIKVYFLTAKFPWSWVIMCEELNEEEVMS